ncbi:hypothetical protein BS333_09345 [Vibrio azureus]|uniref:Uncharacterized protein n=3 Tax=Vibrio azureus TaxID=512649 RepID=U3C6V9_9VIBR|nr:hypothetical protein BS333_09345 [Vibrio azureus]GAD74193.1 hypothetical protein VAZ01S_004_00670 [Vibrio azureus NBRC 104587]
MILSTYFMPIIDLNNIRSMFALNVTNKQPDKFENLENVKSIKNFTDKEFRQKKENQKKENLGHISRFKANFSSSHGRDKKSYLRSL